MEFSVVAEFLRKPELVYEIVSRGERPEGTVKDLRVQLRNVLQKPRAWRDEFVVDSELEACRTRREELEAEIGDGRALLLSSERVRLGTQLSHWAARARLLLSAPELGSDVRSGVEETIKFFELALTNLGEAKSVKDRGTSLLALTPTEERSAYAYPRGTTPVPTVEVSSGAAAAPRVSTGTVAVDHAFCGFGKLPHPLSEIIRTLPRSDGVEVNTLINLLREALRLRELPTVTDKTLMELLVPCCLRPLSDNR